MHGVHFSVYHDWQGSTDNAPITNDYFDPNSVQTSPSFLDGYWCMIFVEKFKIESVHAHFKHTI